MVARFIAVLILVALGAALIPTTNATRAAEVGPVTERRFPPLNIPEGFRATLFACDPLIEYPSVIALGPRAGSLFVAHDYLTGLGFEIVRRDEVRLIEDSDGDGYADKSTVFAGGFNSIQGLEFFDGVVYVMHAPLLTSLRDTNGDGVADERRDLLRGLGLPPEENDNRLHCANGVVAGHDGWLYLALGDRGCDVQRPEGDRLLFQQGGILRCRYDGSDLHVFATGLRNIYDIALDAELNVFVRDNENDGGDYMIRVCHCFFGSDHGYPYHYYERPDEPMRPLADLGRGSSAGGTSYLETAFAPEYRQSLFFCEWGRAVVRYPQTRLGSSFEPMREIDFAAGAENDPYGFKPTDLVVDRDGSLLVSDWCDGQRPKRGRGRIYRISALPGGSLKPAEQRTPQQLDTPALFAQLDSESHHERVAAQLALHRRGPDAAKAVLAATKALELKTLGRLHAVWIIALSGADSAIENLLEIASMDPDARVRAQAIRAIGDLSDPVLVSHKLGAAQGDDAIAERLARFAEQADPRVMLETLQVFRRLHWRQTPQWIGQRISKADPAIDHAIAQSLRHSGNWPAVLNLLNQSPRLRQLGLQATAEQRLPYLATQYIERLASSGNPQHRREYADALCRIVRREKPWTYWGFRPAPRPAATVDWEMTHQIVAALNATLADNDQDVRAFALQQMQREGVAVELPRLADWLREETNDARVSTILKALESRDAATTRQMLREVVLRRALSAANRLAALAALVKGLPTDDLHALIDISKQIEDGPVAAAVLTEFETRLQLDANGLLLARLDSPSAEVRAAAIRALGMRRASAAGDRVSRLLDDENALVRQAAAEASGQIGVMGVADKLLTLASTDQPELVRACLVSLRRLRNSGALEPAVAALQPRASQIAAVEYLHDFGSPRLADTIVAVAAANPAAELQRAVTTTLHAWAERFPDSANEIDRALASVQGQSGQPLLWRIAGPLTTAEADSLVAQLVAGDASRARDLHGGKVRTEIIDSSDSGISLEKGSGGDAESVWLAWSPVHVAEPAEIQVLTSANGWLNVRVGGQLVYSSTKAEAFLPDANRAAATLAAGPNLLLAEVRPGGTPPRLQLRFRRRSSQADHERLHQIALQTRGNASRGKDVFENISKSSCLQCHRLGDKGGQIGPDLAGIGSRFSRIHLIESILEPSRTIAPSYATIVVVLNDGRVLTGVRVAERAGTLLLGDSQGKTHEIPIADIDQIGPQVLSTMPEGLEKKWTDTEFVDLLAFLEAQKKGT
jgi:putative membrane-bound dehydrogenase-like protein